jgi:hypothetical protein
VGSGGRTAISGRPLARTPKRSNLNRTDCETKTLIALVSAHSFSRISLQINIDSFRTVIAHPCDRKPLRAKPKEAIVYHTIEFFINLVADVEVAPQKPLERLLIHQRSRLRVQLKPYVLEGAHGPVEVADLFLEDGSCIRAVPFACLTFVE